MARAIHRAFPREAICYLGDTARIPYGTKSPETVRQYAREIIAFLLARRVKIVVAACNTVSAAALPQLVNDYPVPLRGVVEMGARVALEGRPRRVGVIGTETTIASEAYVRAIHARDPEVQVIQKACPLFVPLIEEGWLEHKVTRLIIAEYLDSMLEEDVDALILGCTHYPLIKPLLAEFFGEKVRIVDSAEAMAAALGEDFANGVIQAAEADRSAESCYFVTDRYNRFREMMSSFMGEGEFRVRQIASDELAACHPVS